MFSSWLSCLRDVFGQNKYSGTISPQRTPDDEPMTYAMVYSWSQSMHVLFKYNVGRRHFAEFCKGEYSDENILFYNAVQELKKEKNKEKMEEKVRIIYEDFVSILSPKEISLDSRVRETLNNCMREPRTDIFDEAQDQIISLMERDSYPRFLKSPLYKDLLASFGVTEEDVEGEWNNQKSIQVT